MQRQLWVAGPIVGIVLAVVLAFMPCSAYACSCVISGTPQEELERADVVFAGKVTNVNAAGGAANSADPVRVTFDVAQVWKGPAAPEVVAMTASSSASCGYNFEENSEYLVYAQTVDNVLQVSLCSRTALLGQAGEDLQALGPGDAVAAASVEPAPSVVAQPSADAPAPDGPVEPETAATATNRTALWLGGGVAVLILAALGAWRWNRT